MLPMSLEISKKPRHLLETLPLEILSIVFSKLVTKERVLCLDVSPEWRAFLLSWPDMWREITTKDHFNIGLSLLPYRSFIHSDAVHELHFDCSEISSWYKPGEPDTTRVIDFLLAQECFRLQKVFMRAAFESEDTFSKFVFLTGRSTITDLELDCKDCEIAAMLILDAILQHYPNLVRCAIKTHRDWPPDRTRLFKDIQPHQHLRSLKVYLSGYRPLPVDIIIRYTPKLKHLTSASLVCEDLDPTLQLLMTSCPEIQTIHLGGSLEQPCLTSSASCSAATVGLRSLYVCHRRHWRGIGLVNVMERHHETLEVLSVLADLGLHQQVVASMASLNFSNMHTLLLDMSDGRAEPTDCNIHMSEFLQRSRRLRHISLNRSSAGDIVLLHGLQTLPYLEALVLNDCRYFTEQAMLRFFGHPNRQSLTHLTMKNIPTMTDDVFEEIGLSCTALETLTIHNNNTCTLLGLQRFLSVHTTKLMSLEVICSTKNCEEQLESILDQLDAHAERWQIAYQPQNRQCYQVVFTHLTWWTKRDQLVHALYKEKS